MKTKIFSLSLLAGVLIASTGCVSIQSASIANVSSDISKTATGAESGIGVLHLTKPDLDDLMSDITQKMAKYCGKLSNVKTILSMREFIVVQSYEVSMTADCSSK